MKQLLTFASLILVGGIIGFFIGRSTSNPTIASSNLYTSNVPDSVDMASTPTIKVNNGAPEGSDQTESSTANVNPVQPVDPQSSPAAMPTEVKSTVPAVPTSLPVTTDCIITEKELSFQFSLHAEQLEKQKIMYSQTPANALKDCSGIFLRMVRFSRSLCSDYLYPDSSKTRDSRSIAKWYHEHNNLSLVQDPMKSRNLIRPGSVMFFGRSNEKYANISIDLIAGTKGKRGVISHMGTVTEVKRDEAGNVIGYTLMHGKRTGKTAGRTYYHNIEPPRLGYPILGNWNQQWVAVANIMTPTNNKQVIAQNTSPAPTPKPNKPSTTSKPKAESKPAPQPSSLAPSLTSLSLPSTAGCVSSDAEWSKELTAFAEQLEAKKIMYTQTPASALADCSGIFFRMVDFVHSKCGDHLYPDMTKTRDSRSLAKWYHDNNNLVLVQDPMKTRNLIRPGSVMFYGRPNEKYSNLTIERMAGTPGKRGSIFHIGVVTEVHKDEQGNVTGYVLMHGKSTGKAAGRTHYHKVEPPRIGYPILGSWNQQWVAIANIMTPQGASLASNN